MNSIPPARNADGPPSCLMPPDIGAHSSRTVVDAAMFYSAVSVFISLLVAYFRQPLGSPGAAVISAYWVSAAAVMFAYAAPLLVGNVKPLERRSATIALINFLAVSALLTATGYWGVAISLTILFVGVGVNRRIMRQYALPSVVVVLLAAVAAAIFAAACFILVNSMNYATIFSPERALAGIHNRDQLFHASIASMFAHYGVAGTGLDGLQPFGYHLLSHIWLGMTAEGFGVNSVFGYFLGMQIVAIPLAYFSVTVATTAFAEPTSKPANRVLMLAMPIAVLFAFEQWNWLSYLVSESHILGLILLLVALPMLKSISLQSDRPLPYGIIATGFAIGLLALAAKVSVGFVWFAGFLYLSVRMKRIPRLHYPVFAILLLGTAWVTMTYLLPIEHSDNGRIAPFHFFKLYPTAAMANLVPIMLAVTLQIVRWRSSSAPDRLWRETIVVMLIASAAPTFMLQLDGGSAYYFINIGTWIAVAALAGQAMSLSHLADSRIASTACLAVIVASFLHHPEKNYAHRKFVVERDRLAEHVLQRANDPEIEGAAIYDRVALREMAAEIRNSVGAKLSQAFDSAGLRAGGETAIFIEPSFDEFWSMHPECAMPQFLIPSYFGVPLLKGLPPVGRACELGIYYSLPSYGTDAASSAITDPELCDEALERGFTSVLRVFSQDTTRTLHCG